MEEELGLLVWSGRILAGLGTIPMKAQDMETFRIRWRQWSVMVDSLQNREKLISNLGLNPKDIMVQTPQEIMLSMWDMMRSYHPHD